MDRTLLGKALGAIASYATARDVPAARVVFRDAVRVRREHAFLVPAGAQLPFTPRGPVFRFK